MASLRHPDAEAIPPTTVSAGRLTLEKTYKPTISMKGIIHTFGMMLSLSIHSGYLNVG
jgi:hypothetical protein